MHVGVVKVGLLRLAKSEVISLHLISGKNSMLDRTLTTPKIYTSKQLTNLEHTLSGSVCCIKRVIKSVIIFLQLDSIGH